MEEQLQAWDRVWEPLRTDYCLRYQVSPDRWEAGEAETLSFFRERYPILLRDVLSWYERFPESAAPPIPAQ